MNKPRLAIVLPVYWPAVGGCELHTHELALRLARRYDVRVITLVNNEADKLAHELWVAAILRAPQSNTIAWDGAIPVTRLGMRRLHKLVFASLARIQSPKVPDAVVCAAMELLARRYRRSVEPLLRDVDIVHSVHGGVSFLGYATLLAARRLRLPFVFTPLMHLQEGLGEAAGNPGGALSLHLIPRTWTDAYWKRIWQQADALLTMTDHEREFYIREGVPGERVFRTGVGPMSEPHERAKPTGVEDERVVLFLGRNTLAKGVGDVVRAAPLVWAQMPAVRFVIAGPRTPETDAMLSAATDPRMEVLGEVSEARKAELFRDCTVFCMPSREESLGATYLEAWSYGKPVVGLRIPPVEELTGHGRGGLVATPDPRDVADKLLALLGNDQLRREMGRWGRQQVLERYSWNTIVERTEAIYQSLVERPPQARIAAVQP